jgi:hypothetical protein
MTHVKTTDPEFLAQIESWINQYGEVLVLLRYPYAAGSRDFVFFHRMEDFHSALQKLGSRTWVIAYGEPQLPLRGQVDDVLIQRALGQIPDGREYLIVCLEKTVEDYPPRYRREYEETAGETHEELRESLNELRGRRVGVGLFPPWADESERTIEAFVPDEDGEVRSAAY